MSRKSKTIPGLYVLCGCGGWRKNHPWDCSYVPATYADVVELTNTDALLGTSEGKAPEPDEKPPMIYTETPYRNEER